MFGEPICTPLSVCVCVCVGPGRLTSLFSPPFLLRDDVCRQWYSRPPPSSDLSHTGAAAAAAASTYDTHEPQNNVYVRETQRQTKAEFSLFCFSQGWGTGVGTLIKYPNTG